MWSIAYEFRCYILVLIVGLVGGLSKRAIVLAATAGLVALSMTDLDRRMPWPEQFESLIGVPSQNASLIGIFGAGACFYLFRGRIPYDGRAAAISAALFGLLMFSPVLATLSVAVFGGYLLFWFAFSVRSPRLAAVGARIDLSYGVYLYAFPIQNMLIRFDHALSPWTVSGATIILASGLAWLSWRFVEKPALDLRGLPARSANFVKQCLGRGA